MALLPRDPNGNPEPVFWEAERRMAMEQVVEPGAAPTLDQDAGVRISLANVKFRPDMKTSLDDARKTAEVLNTGMIKKVIT